MNKSLKIIIISNITIYVEINSKKNIKELFLHTTDNKDFLLVIFDEFLFILYS